MRDAIASAVARATRPERVARLDQTPARLDRCGEARLRRTRRECLDRPQLHRRNLVQEHARLEHRLVRSFREERRRAQLEAAARAQVDVPDLGDVGHGLMRSMMATLGLAHQSDRCASMTSARSRSCWAFPILCFSARQE
jgi:hypothetical protein